MSWMSAIRARYSVAANPLRTQRRIELGVLVLGLVLCLQLLYSGARLALPSAPQAVAPSTDVLQVKPVTGLAAVASEASDEIRNRPLFWQGRRATGSSQADNRLARQQAGKLKDVKLLGVFGGGDTAGIIALVKDKKQRILLGEAVQGWTLETVESNRVVLVEGVRREELVLLPGKVVALAEDAIEDAENPRANRRPQSSKTGAPGDDKGKVGDKPAAPVPATRRGLSMGGRAPVPAVGDKRLQ